MSHCTKKVANKHWKVYENLKIDFKILNLEGISCLFMETLYVMDLFSVKVMKRFYTSKTVKVEKP